MPGKKLKSSVVAALAGLSILLLLLLPFLGFWTVPTVDDYAILDQAKSMSGLDSGIHSYYHWDGRFVHYFLLGSLLRDISMLRWVTVLWAILFAAIAVLIDKSTFRFSRPEDMPFRILRVGLIAASMWLGLRPLLSDSVFWATCGIYTLWAAAGLAWIHILSKSLTRQDTPVRLPATVLWCFAGFVVGAFTANLTAGLLVVHGWLLYRLKNRIRKESGTRRTLISASLGLLAGLVFLLTAPGVMERVSSMDSGFDTNPAHLLQSLADILAVHLHSGTLFPVFLLASAVAVSMLRPDSAAEGFTHEEKNETLHPGFLIWCLAGIATILPMLAVPELGLQKRTGLFLLVFAGVGFLAAAFRLVDRWKQGRALKPGGKTTVVGVALSMLLLGASIYYLIRDTSLAVALHNEVFSRHNLILETAEPGRSMVIPSIRASTPTPVKFYDIRKDPLHDINRWVASYYGLDSIRRE